MDPNIQNTIILVIEAVGAFMVAATAIVAFFNGPKADKARGIIDTLLSFLRMIGFGTFKDEPGTASVPLFPDSGKRIVSTETVK